MGEQVPEVEELAVTKRDASSLTMDPCFWSTDECDIPEQQQQRVVAASSNEEIIGLQDVFDTKGLPCITSDEGCSVEARAAIELPETDLAANGNAAEGPLLDPCFWEEGCMAVAA